MESQIGRLKWAQVLFLVLALLCTIMSVPLVGYLISIISLGLIHLLLLSFAIITLIFALRASAPRTGTLFVMIAVVPGIISAVLMFNGIRIAGQLGLNIRGATHAYEAMHSGELMVFFVGFNIGLISWTFYLLAAILLFLNVANVRMRYQGIEQGYSLPTKSAKSAKTLNAKSILRDEQVEQAMGFQPEYDENNEKTEAQTKNVDEVRAPKVAKQKKVDVKHKKVKEKSSNKVTTKAKTKKTAEKLKTDKPKATNTRKPKKPTKAKGVNKNPKNPKQDK